MIASVFTRKEVVHMPGLQDEMLKLMMKAEKLGSSNDFEHRITDAAQKIHESAKESVAMKDSYGNSLLSIGNKDIGEHFSNYNFDNNTLNWWLWLALYNDSWVFRRTIDKPSQDMIRCGITLQGSNTKYAEVYRKLKQHRFDFIQLLQWGSLFGGSIACVLFDNFSDEDYKNPMNIEKARKTKTMRFYVVDRWYGVAPSSDMVDDMSSIDYGKPKSYEVTFADGVTKTLHHDYVLRYEHRTAPKLIKNGQLQGWGYAEGAHILGELSRDEKLKTSVQSLIDKSLIEVIKMAGMRGIFMGQDAENEEQLRKRLEMVNWGRNFNSLTFLDKEDEYQEHGFAGLTGLSNLLEQNMWQISAAVEMQGVLFGDLKQGFSNDTDALERYDETINGRCENYLRPVYEKFLGLLFQLEEIDEKVEFTFDSLLVKKQDEDRIEGLDKFVDLCAKLQDIGVLNPKLTGQAVATYVNKGEIDFGLTQDELDKLDDKFEEEMENIKLEV